MADPHRSGPPSHLWTAAAVALILLATLPPQPEGQVSPTRLFATAFPRSLGDWLDIGQNVALYLPLGLALARRCSSVASLTACALATSLAIELLQFLIPGRDPSLRDVLANGSGALLGGYIWIAAAGRTPTHFVQRWETVVTGLSPQQASVCSMAWSVGVALGLALTGALLQPALPPFGYSVSGPYFDRQPGPLRIGNNGSDGGGFRGEIDEVRIFDRARPAEEIREDMSRSAARSKDAAGGLVAAFAFDANSSTTARDESGHGHDATLHGAVWTDQGRLGGALSFDGSSEALLPAAAALDLVDGMTLEAWVRPAATAVGEPAIVSKQGSHYYLDQASAFGAFNPAAGGHFGGVPRYVRLTDPIPSGQWTHLATTYDGQVLSLYRNGRLEASKVHWSPHRSTRLQVNAVDLPYGDVADTNGLRNQLVQRPTLDLALTCGERSARRAPVILIVGLQDTHVLAWEAAGDDLFIRPWTWARRFRLASPPTRVPGALLDCAPGRTIALSMTGPLQSPTVARDSHSLDVSTPGLGSAWAFVVHSDLLPVWVHLAGTAVWLGALYVPLGFWARGNALSALALALPVGVSFLAASALEIRDLSVTEMGAMAAGSVVGVLWRRNLCS